MGSREEVSRAFANILGKSCVKSQKSFKRLMVDAGLNPDFFVFEQLDADNDGKVTWEEFRARLQPPFDVMDFLRSVFSQVSADENGAVSKEELTERFECVLDCSDAKSKKTFRALVQEAGLKAEFYVFEKPYANGGERIAWDEFEASLKPAGVGKTRRCQPSWLRTPPRFVKRNSWSRGQKRWELAVACVAVVEAARCQCFFQPTHGWAHSEMSAAPEAFFESSTFALLARRAVPMCMESSNDRSKRAYFSERLRASGSSVPRSRKLVWDANSRTL